MRTCELWTAEAGKYGLRVVKCSHIGLGKRQCNHGTWDNTAAEVKLHLYATVCMPMLLILYYSTTVLLSLLLLNTIEPVNHHNLFQSTLGVPCPVCLWFAYVYNNVRLNYMYAV